jgi:hypothetical protein
MPNGKCLKPDEQRRKCDGEYLKPDWRLLKLDGMTISFFPENNADLKTPSSTADSEIVKKSANKGGFNIKIMTQGTYRVILKKAGYTEQIVTIYVNDGEMAIVQVELEKA